MSLRSSLAAICAKTSYRILHDLLKRNASQLPGRVALAIDPEAILHASKNLSAYKVVVCGTNGKTTTNNLIANALETKDAHVAANREGANMAAGVASALIQNSCAKSCAIEADELSTINILPALKPDYLLLLNLFRDQLDRAGEIDRVQDVIVNALGKTANTALVVCADDPLSAGVAYRAQEAGTKIISFGIAQDVGQAQDRVPEARFCQKCGSELHYHYKSYAQLGDFFCPNCDFKRCELDYFAKDIRITPNGISFVVDGATLDQPVVLTTHFSGIYMIYNILAAFVISHLAGVSADDFKSILAAYAPKNGRLQHFVIKGVKITLNLAKNPTGFNQNIALVNASEASKSSFIVINDNFNDGKDVSWLWDVDFERLCGQNKLFVGGLRAHDMQVRMKYAGATATIAQSAREVIDEVSKLEGDQELFVLCNYSALWPIKAELEALEKSHV